jgi:hypothetical protein
MKAVRLLIAVGFVAALVYYYFNPLPDFVHQAAATLMPVSKEEKEVRGVFTRYADLLMRGDPLCEGVYMPNSTFQLVDATAHGDPRGRALTTSQHRLALQEILARIRGGQLRIRFAEVQCRELPDGKVRLTCNEILNNERSEHLSMVFVNTAPERWAVIEETYRAQ